MAWRILSSISFLNRLQVSFDWRSKCSTIRKTTTPSKEKRKERIIYVNGEVLFGYHSVRLAVEAEQRLFHAVYYSDTSPRVQDIVALAESKGIPVKPVSRNFLTQMTEQTAKIGGAHKGICADVAPIQQKSADSIIHHQEEVNRQLWLLLCSVGDPYNLGAIIRSAYFLGVDRVFTCSPWDCAQSSAPLTPVASRASAGSVEIFTPMVVRHPELFLDTLADRGWEILGSGTAATPSPASSTSRKGVVGSNKILLMGNEGDGISPSLSKKCTTFIRLSPGRDLHACVDSLNVSVAAALLIRQIKES